MSARAAALAAALAGVLSAWGPAAFAAAPPAATEAATPDTLRLTVDDAVALALERAAEMRIADADRAAASGRIREAGAEALPQVTGSVDYTRRFSSVFSGASVDSTFAPLLENSPFAAVNTYTVDLTASQILFSRRVGAGIGAARAYRRLVEANRAQTADDVKLQAREAYLDAAATERLLHIARVGREQARAHLREVQLYRREGTRAEYDLIRARVDAMNAEPPVVSAANDHILAMLELKRVAGLPYAQPIALVSAPALDPARVPVADLGAAGTLERPALRAAAADIEGRRRLLAVERAARWPELKASTTLSHQAFPSDRLPRADDFHRDFQGSLKLDFPMFLGLKTFGSIQRAQADLRQAEARRDQLQRSVELDAERARQEVRRTLAVLAARRGTAALAQRAHELAGVRYSNGLATELEVSDARYQMLAAQGNEVIAARDYRVALARLEHALGYPVPVSERSLDTIPAEAPEEGSPR